MAGPGLVRALACKSKMGSQGAWSYEKEGKDEAQEIQREH